ncbi:PEP-CTERM sorting domain-containing protein [Pseudoduganella lutea]|nr:PEP-CTERM sorting domain-containing protein [Pseudoduganella lutea]
MNITKLFRTALAACALFAGVAGTANAEFFSHVGDSTGAPTWDVDAAFDAVGTAVPYQAFDFHVDEDGVYKILLAARFDSMVILYEGGFDAAAPNENRVRFSDDLLSPNTSGLRWGLTAGTQYTFVVTGFNDSEYGAYSFTIGGPGNIIPGPVFNNPVAAVPEPSTWLMLGLGLAAVGFTARRKAAHG